MFVRITFRDGVPQKTRGGYDLGLTSLQENHVLYVDSVLGVNANDVVDFWLLVLNSWKTNTFSSP